MDIMEIAQIDKIKKIWIEKTEEGKTNFEIFSSLTEFYAEAGKPVRGNSDWFKFARLVGKWKKELEEKERKREISDEEAEEMQNQNRKKTIILLAGLIEKAQKNPEGIKDWEMSKIMTFYKTIQSAEEAKRKTDIASKKIGTKEKRIFFPYLRMEDDEINKLKENLNESFIRIEKFKRGQTSK